jgi:hypothetical protein
MYDIVREIDYLVKRREAIWNHPSGPSKTKVFDWLTKR